MSSNEDTLHHKWNSAAFLPSRLTINVGEVCQKRQMCPGGPSFLQKMPLTAAISPEGVLYTKCIHLRHVQLSSRLRDSMISPEEASKHGDESNSHRYTIMSMGETLGYSGELPLFKSTARNHKIHHLNEHNLSFSPSPDYTSLTPPFDLARNESTLVHWQIHAELTNDLFVCHLLQRSSHTAYTVRN